MSAEQRFLEFDSPDERYMGRLSRFGKLFLGLICIVFLVSCNRDSAPDCFQNSGDTVRYEVAVPIFDKITVFENVGLVIKQGTEYKVEVVTGEYLRNDVLVEVEGGRLLLRDTNNCNLFRAYGTTTVFVTAPNINEIRSSTGLLVKSDGVLQYPNLDLISESFINDESETTDGSFDLEVDMVNLRIVVNGIAYFKLRGQTELADFTIAAGDARIEAETLMAQFVALDHRGTNDILSNPQQSITGDIRGTGDVIALSEPPLVQVSELYKGRLIFKN